MSESHIDKLLEEFNIDLDDDDNVQESFDLLPSEEDMDTLEGILSN